MVSSFVSSQPPAARNRKRPDYKEAITAAAAPAGTSLIIGPGENFFMDY
jgi:hypothetical protein